MPMMLTIQWMEGSEVHPNQNMPWIFSQHGSERGQSCPVIGSTTYRREQRGGKQGGYESLFLRAQAVLLDVGFEVEVDVRYVDGDADDAADDDASKDNAQLADVEAVDANVDEREGLEEGVVDAWSDCEDDVRGAGWGERHDDLPYIKLV